MTKQTNKQTQSRAEIRSKIFGNKKAQIVEITLFDAKIELRQPSLKEIMDAQNETDKNYAVASMLIKYCYVPGTEERVFDKGDIDQIMDLPFGEDLQNLQKSITSLLGIDIGEAEKDLKANPS